MNFLEFKKKLNNYIIFNIRDIRKIENNFDLRRLNEWQKKDYIKMIRREYYIFSDLEINESVLFLIANRIYLPSYISFEMAFSYYNLIPEAFYEITSASSRKTNSFRTDLGVFNYRRLKSELMFGYKLVECKNQSFKIAEIEKVLLDYFYLNTRLKTENDFIEMRFNGEEFKSLANIDKLNKYLKVFNNKTLGKRVKRFLKYINYA